MNMQIGVVFPQTEIGADRGAVRAYAQRVEELGFSHLLAYDHVVGADPEVHAPWKGPYNIDTTFHEPFVLFGYLAAITAMELVTGIIILPQRQTALVAKQAAEVDLLTDGRFRLGIGLGWNTVEYEALGTNFSDRGKRMGEQVELLRRAVDATIGHLRRRPTSTSPAPGSRRCRCNARFPCGSAPRRSLRTGGRAGWPTDGSHRCRRARRSTRRARSSRTPRARPVAIRVRWVWKGA